MHVKSPWLGIFLAVLHGLAGLAILIVSSWFIAACAVASVNFNYMLPAVVIRALALIRIASGYAQLWVGHRHLLSVTATLRDHLFSRFDKKASDFDNSYVDVLVTHIDSVAAIWVSWVAQQASAILMLLGCAVALIVLDVPLSLYIVIIGGVWFIATALLALKGLQLARRQIVSEQQFRNDASDYVSASSLWHLQSGAGVIRGAPSAEEMWQLAQQQDTTSQHTLWWVQGVSWLLLLTGLATVNEPEKGNALLLVVPMLLLSAADWLGRSIVTQPALNRYMQGKEALNAIDPPTLPVFKAHNDWQHLALVGLKAKNLPVRAFSGVFPKKGVVWLTGSSGSGKTLLLKAIAGQAPSDGTRAVDKTPLPAGRVSNWLYLEQDPVILSATIKQNLQVAAPKVSDTSLTEALSAVGLAYLSPLNTWLGPEGRTLSGGEKKRVAVARALLSDHDVWLVDEPFEGLDNNAIKQLFDIFEWQSQYRLVVIASHIFMQSGNDTQLFRLDDLE